MEGLPACPQISIGLTGKSVKENSSAGMSNESCPTEFRPADVTIAAYKSQGPGIPWPFFLLRLTKAKDFGSTDNLVTLSRLGFL